MFAVILLSFHCSLVVFLLSFYCNLVVILLSFYCNFLVILLSFHCNFIVILLSFHCNLVVLLLSFYCCHLIVLSLSFYCHLSSVLCHSCRTRYKKETNLKKKKSQRKNPIFFVLQHVCVSMCGEISFQKKYMYISIREKRSTTVTYIQRTYIVLQGVAGCCRVLQCTAECCRHQFVRRKSADMVTYIGM